MSSTYFQTYDSWNCVANYMNLPDAIALSSTCRFLHNWAKYVYTPSILDFASFSPKSRHIMTDKWFKRLKKTANGAQLRRVSTIDLSGTLIGRRTVERIFRLRNIKDLRLKNCTLIDDVRIAELAKIQHTDRMRKLYGRSVLQIALGECNIFESLVSWNVYQQLASVAPWLQFDRWQCPRSGKKHRHIVLYDPKVPDKCNDCTLVRQISCSDLETSAEKTCFRCKIPKCENCLTSFGTTELETGHLIDLYYCRNCRLHVKTECVICHDLIFKNASKECFICSGRVCNEHYNTCQTYSCPLMPGHGDLVHHFCGRCWEFDTYI
ncbi:hypothetical protein NEOLI_004836 [Neolecta irregularis DAH-3]|uniref:F-box domain-containing protein n=1 Tax=Neolecta irregularis (strain DAH-3) TaxID=1198029 RepID=A0A1U7LQA2_NEOID|nr:hypothetical protein NEOLI_004836 [Neolecta irregularis DAH-3]|eukprot:OLL24763.1 hypothetical protein NEOLI_004836 [Neolecta irregularis DAH-3]